MPLFIQSQPINSASDKNTIRKFEGISTLSLYFIFAAQNEHETTVISKRKMLPLIAVRLKSENSEISKTVARVQPPVSAFFSLSLPFPLSCSAFYPIFDFPLLRYFSLFCAEIIRAFVAIIRDRKVIYFRHNESAKMLRLKCMKCNCNFLSSNRRIHFTVPTLVHVLVGFMSF